MTGVRIQLFGTLAYRVGLEYRGQPRQLFIAGDHSSHFIHDIPSAPRGLRAWWHWLLERCWNETEVDRRPALEADYVEEVREGRTHLSDDRRLIRQLARQVGVEYVVTKEGYRLSLESGNSRPENAVREFKIHLDFDEQDLLLVCTSTELGPAHRDLFPTALQESGKLEIGRIAIVPDASGQEAFALVDCRPYALLSVVNFGRLLQALAQQTDDLSYRRVFV